MTLGTILKAEAQYKMAEVVTLAALGAEIGVIGVSIAKLGLGIMAAGGVDAAAANAMTETNPREVERGNKIIGIGAMITSLGIIVTTGVVTAMGAMPAPVAAALSTGAFFG